MFKLLAGGWWISYFAAHWLCIFGLGVAPGTVVHFLVGSVIVSLLAMGHETNVLKIKTQHLRELNEDFGKVRETMQEFAERTRLKQ